ncbi:hypothetical protein BKA64DRAFT_742228 [Cadophora sp. MPI-SDFR-AT-0126]|nr:hypothetical protein BKA64DRAFT_742228 [Leotiomycetes sp. MPI-SDFR-AT-0126]
MEAHSRRPSFKNEFMPPPDPPSQSTDRLSDKALMALPFIGMFVGVDELVPTKAIYAVYDPSNCGITYLHVDGTFAVARHICFTKQFKDPSIPLHRSQRAYLPELMARSALHYRQINRRDFFSADIVLKFPTQSSAKASLTYVEDLVMGSCLALTSFDATPNGPDRAPPHIDLEDKPIWDFNTTDFQAVTVPRDEVFHSKYGEFKWQYPTVGINVVDFQLAAFCLAGMLKQRLVSFLYEGQNDRRYFVRNQTPVKEPALVAPLRTAKGWTVDCFLARFGKFQKVYTKGTYAQIPNPINWLESEMENETRLERQKVPWSIELGRKDDSVAPRPPRLDDIVSKSEEGGFVPGHMVSRSRAINEQNRHNNALGHQAGRGFFANKPKTFAPIAGQKRKCSNGQGSSQNPTIIHDSDELEEEQLRIVNHNTKIESCEVEVEDIYNDSDSERKRKKKLRRKSQSRKTKSLVPGADFLFASPGRTLRDEELTFSLGSVANSQQETPQSLRSGNPSSQVYPKSQVDIGGSDSEEEARRAWKENKGSPKSGDYWQDLGYKYESSKVTER